MLSFLREQGGANVPSRRPDAAGKTPKTDAEQSQEQYLTVASHKRRTRKSTIVLAVLFIAGLLCLWFMIRKSTPSSALATTTDKTEDAKIEESLTRLTGAKSEMSLGMDEIVKKFYEYSDVPQVRVGELTKNPFTVDLYGVDKKETTAETPKINTALAWRREVQKKALSLQLVSIMQSDQGTCCMIGEKILRKGDSIQGFKVCEIGGDSVKLEWSPEVDNRPAGTESERIETVLKLPD